MPQGLSFDLMSNAELNIKLVELENEYKALQNRIRPMIEKMESLDMEYTKIKDILSKRLKGNK